MSDPVELRFPLDVKDDWPPVAVEGLPFHVTSAGYVSTTPPLFVSGMSVGDVIAVELEEDGVVASWSHVSRSPHSVVWLLRIGKTEQIEDTLKDLRAVGCSTVSLSSAGAHAIDVPGDLPFARVDAILAKLDAGKVAVAYPSFRHADEENKTSD